MLCPRCNFDGEPINGACSYCGYRRVSVSGILPEISVSNTRPLTGEFQALTKPLRAMLSGRSQPLSLYKASIGDTLNQGRYHLVEQLALPENQQGQGTAWTAIDMVAGQNQVVVREVPGYAEGQRDTKKLFMVMTSQLAEGVVQGGIPRVLDSFNEHGHHFLVLQHIEGESLASLMRRQKGALPEATIAEYGRQLCEILTLMASEDPPIVHGAISPETIIVTPDRRRVYLIHMPPVPPNAPAESDAVPGYRPPEQMRGVLESSSDLYAVAATMHHALTGSDPRENVAFFYPLARRLNAAISPSMEAILEHALRLSPSQRYGSAAEMQKDLVRLLASSLPEQENVQRVTTDALDIDMMRMRLRGQRRSMRDLSLVGGATLIILVFLLIFWNVTPILKFGLGVKATPNATATLAATYQKGLNQELQTYQKEHVGLSDGLFVFDVFSGHSSTELQDKLLATQALQSGNMASAVSLYSRAVRADPTDAEARIYGQDIQIKGSGSPYVTLVLGLSLNSDAANLSQGRTILQAAYEYQNQVNTQHLLPGNMQLRVLVANTGDTANDTTQVGTIAQYVTNRVREGNPDKIIAVVGWPKTDATQNALPALAALHIPVVSQSASGTELTGLSPYFFRLSPPNDIQGQELGTFAVQYLRAKRIVVVQDRNDAYSRELASAFSSTIKSLGALPFSADLPLADTHGGATVTQFQDGPLQEAIESQADLIFLAGYGQDAVRMAHAIGEGFRTYPWSTYLANLGVLGGDAFDTDVLLGHGTGQDGFLARQYAKDMQRVTFASFGDPSEWEGRATPPFFQGWSNLYQVAKSVAPITSDAIVTNDAFGVIIDALKLVQGPLTGEKLRSALASLGQGNVPAYQGLSGRIYFGGDGNPVNKALVILKLIQGPSLKVNNVRLVSYAGQF